jgi:ubiquinone/menaquinone biosynthesis C-methylase UbiE
VHRVLKPGGRFVIVDFSSESGSFLGHLLSVLGHAHGKSTFPSLEAKLKSAGFGKVEQLPSKRKGTMIVKAS